MNPVIYLFTGQVTVPAYTGGFISRYWSFDFDVFSSFLNIGMCEMSRKLDFNNMGTFGSGWYSVT